MLELTAPRKRLRLVALSTLACALALAGQAQAADVDPVVLTFSSVGDSRQDPNAFDEASVGVTLNGQDSLWLQNTNLPRASCAPSSRRSRRCCSSTAT